MDQQTMLARVRRRLLNATALANGLGSSVDRRAATARVATAVCQIEAEMRAFKTMSGLHLPRSWPGGCLARGLHELLASVWVKLGYDCLARSDFPAAQKYFMFCMRSLDSPIIPLSSARAAAEPLNRPIEQISGWIFSGGSVGIAASFLLPGW